MASRRRLLAAATGLLALASSPALAAPKTARAKAEFDKGVAAYRAKDWKTANAAFRRSNDLEHDVETMFALAQTEKQLEHCEAANALYDEILADKALPKGNRDAIEKARGECVEILAGANPPPPPTDPPVEPPPPRHVDRPKLVHHHHWYADATGDTFSILGVVALGASPYLYHLAIVDRRNAPNATTHQGLLDLESRATTEYDAAIGCAVGGGVLLIAGVGWYLSHRGGDGPPPVTAWVTPESSGVAFSGRF